jgi:hypothetical protein
MRTLASAVNAAAKRNPEFELVMRRESSCLRPGHGVALAACAEIWELVDLALLPLCYPTTRYEPKQAGTAKPTSCPKCLYFWDLLRTAEDRPEWRWPNYKTAALALS